MSPGIRNSLTNVRARIENEPQNYSHAGLVFDKFVRSVSRDDKEAQRDHINLVGDIARMQDYKLHVDRWHKALKDLNVKVYKMKAKPSAPLIVGLGSESVIEVSLAMHRTYSVPYIPGSALKGLAASYAHRMLGDALWRKGGKAHSVVFGDTDQAGYVTFYDALPLDFTLHPDVMTVHHSDYYMKDNVPPADWDGPTPISFLSVSGTFLLAVGGLTEWADAAVRILDYALREYGIGAKTSSGYGRLEIQGSPLQEQREEEEEARKKKREEEEEARRRLEAEQNVEQGQVDTFRQGFASVRDNKLRGAIGGQVGRLEKLKVSTETKKKLASEVLERAERVLGLQVNNEWYTTLNKLSRGEEI